MGILGTLHNMAKSGQVNEIHSVINQERASANTSAQTSGKERRKFRHNMEISIASYRLSAFTYFFIPIFPISFLCKVKPYGFPRGVLLFYLYLSS